MIKRLYTFALAATFAMVGCVATPEEYDPDYLISFNPAVSAIEGDPASVSAVYPTSSTFGVWAFQLGEGKTWASDASQATTYLNDAAVSNNSGTWKTADSKHWGATGEQLSFFAYSPSSLGVKYDSAKGLTLDSYDTLNDKVDFLYTDVQADREKNAVSGVVALPFKHAVSEVEFRAMSSQSDVSIVIKSVKLGDVHHKGAFHSLPSAAWDLTADKTDLEFCAKETKLNTKEQSLAIFPVLAQGDARPVSVLFDIYVGETRTDADIQLTAKPLTGKWTVGRKYVYTLDIMSNSVTYKTDVID